MQDLGHFGGHTMNQQHHRTAWPSSLETSENCFQTEPCMYHLGCISPKSNCTWRETFFVQGQDLQNIILLFGGD